MSGKVNKKEKIKKLEWKGGNMLYPLPVVMVTVRDSQGKDNIITLAWAGTICTNPPMVSISVRKERYSYKMLEENPEFVINLTTESLTFATDYCGVKSGRDVDKFSYLNLHKREATHVNVAMIEEAPVNLECKIVKKEELGSHDCFMAEVLAVHVDETYMDEKNKFHLEKAKPIVYSHGAYYGIGELRGNFGYSIRKNTKSKKKK